MGDKINKKLSEEELDRLLEEQFLRESQFIEEGLSIDDSGRWNEESDEEIENAYEKLVARLQTEGVYREETGASGLESNRENKVELSEELVPEIRENNKITYKQNHKPGKNTKSGTKRPNGYQGMRAAGIGIVIAVGVCAAAMNSKTNNASIVSNVKVLLQDDSGIANCGDKENDEEQKDNYDLTRSSYSVLNK